MDVPLYSSLLTNQLNKSFGTFAVDKRASFVLKPNSLFIHHFFKLHNELEIEFANIRV